MNIKLMYTTIIDEKISSFAQVLMEVYNFYRGCVNYGPPCNTDDTLDYNAVNDALVTSTNSNNYNLNTLENHGSIPSVIAIATSYPTQKSVADEFRLNKEQRAAFMITTSHLEGDKRCRTGIFLLQIDIKQNMIIIGGNDGQLIICIPRCGGTRKSQLVRAIAKYFSITKRMQMIRKLTAQSDKNAGKRV